MDSDVLYFLPWGMPLAAAYWGGLLPLPFIACYETPTHLVSADPVESVVALHAIINDAAAVILARRNPEPPLLIGFSLGTIAATYLANLFHAPLLSICGAARGEDMMWSCPAAAHVRLEAERRGYGRTHFSAAFDSLNPARNLNNLDQRSLFVVGSHDSFVPSSLRSDWIDIVRSQTPELRIDVRTAGHIEAIWGSRPLQRQWVQTRIADRVYV